MANLNLRVSRVKILTSAALTVGCALVSTASVAKGGADTLPVAEAGECYAKVSVPAMYKNETVTAVVREAAEEITIIPAKYITVDEKVMVREASTELVPVPPVMEEVDEKVLLSSASRLWVRSNIKSDVPASAGVMADLAKSGVNVAGVPTGRCYHEFYKPATFTDVEDRFMVDQASEKLTVTPAQFARSEKKVMLKAAANILTAAPAEFKTVSEKIMIEPAHAQWKKGRGPIERIDNSTGEIMCRVNVPARYETVKKEVLHKAAFTSSTTVPAVYETIAVEKLSIDAQESRVAVPAKYETFTRRKKVTDAKFSWLAKARGNPDVNGEPTGIVVCHREIPAKYKEFKRRIVKKPGSFTVVKQPAEYETLKVQKLFANATEQRVPVVAEETELQRRIKLSDARLEWRPVLCETNMTRDVVKQIQQSLNGKGYSAGAADGLLGRGTLRALEKFQEDRNLAQGGLTYATIEALGVDF